MSIGVPKSKGSSIWKTSVDAASSFWATDWAAANSHGEPVVFWRLNFILGTAAQVKVRMFNSTASTYATAAFGSDANAAANALYSYVMEARNGFSYNYELSATTTVNMFTVSEITGEII